MYYNYQVPIMADFMARLMPDSCLCTSFTVHCTVLHTHSLKSNLAFVYFSRWKAGIPPEYTPAAASGEEPVFIDVIETSVIFLECTAFLLAKHRQSRALRIALHNWTSYGFEDMSCTFHLYWRGIAWEWLAAEWLWKHHTLSYSLTVWLNHKWIQL